MTQLTILEANFLKTNKHSERDHALLLAQGADLIGINEGRHFVKLFANSPGYDAVIPRTKGARQNNPILCRAGLGLTSFAAYDMCFRVNKSPARAATLVRYNFHGQTRAHIVTHTNAHIENAGRPRSLPRVAQDVIHMRRLARLVRRYQRAGYKVTVAGDFNWAWGRGERGWYWSPKRVFNRLGLAVQWEDPSAPKGGSLGRRRIDYIAYDPADLMVLRQGFVKGEHSDHSWPIVTFRVKGL